MEGAEGPDPLGAELVCAEALAQIADLAEGDLAMAPLGELIDRCAGEQTPQALAVALLFAELIPDADLRAKAAEAVQQLS